MVCTCAVCRATLPYSIGTASVLPCHDSCKIVLYKAASHGCSLPSLTKKDCACLCRKVEGCGLFNRVLAQHSPSSQGSHVEGLLGGVPHPADLFSRPPQAGFVTTSALMSISTGSEELSMTLSSVSPGGSAAGTNTGAAPEGVATLCAPWARVIVRPFCLISYVHCA